MSLSSFPAGMDVYFPFGVPSAACAPLTARLRGRTHRGFSSALAEYLYLCDQYGRADALQRIVMPQVRNIAYRAALSDGLVT